MEPPYYDLTKWPRLLVSGKDVTPEQADEILIRTCVPDYLRGNDRAWADAIGELLGLDIGYDAKIPKEIEEVPALRLAWFKERWARQDARQKELGILGLEYLYTSRLASSYIGGPHGWCDWDGRIYTDSYNIGKWPSAEEVTSEWSDIATAFPYLDLTAQLISDEGDGQLVGEWRVKDGTAVYVPEFSERLPVPSEEEEMAAMQTSVDRLVHDPFCERGASLERVAAAVERVKVLRGLV